MRTPTQTNNELFNRFWKAYPLKEGKPKALRSFEKLGITAETLEKVLAELDRQYRRVHTRHDKRSSTAVHDTCGRSTYRNRDPHRGASEHYSYRCQSSHRSDASDTGSRRADVHGYGGIFHIFIHALTYF